MVNSSRGRPAGGSDARERLVNAATALFVEHGYGRTSSREIARQAGVSHSLVNYYFGSKEGLFAEVMAINMRPSTVIGQAFGGRGLGPMGMARRVVTTAVTTWDHPDVRESVVALISGAMSDDSLRSAMAEFFEGEIFGQIRGYVGGRDAASRAAGIAGVMAGIIYTRYVIRVEPIASMPAAEIVRIFSPAVAVQLR